MDQENQRSTRRRLLKAGAVSGVTLAGLPGIVGAQGGGRGGDVDIEWARNLNGIAGNGTYVSANAAVGLFPTRKLLPAYSFDIERLSTGEVIRVSVELNSRPPDARGAIFDFYDWEGRLARNSPRPPGSIEVWNGSEFVPVDYSLSGDLDIFRGGTSYDEYEVTLHRGGGTVDTTSRHLVPIRHEKQFEDTNVDDGDTLQLSFNASGLPSDADLQAIIDPGSTRIIAPTYYHDGGRYYAELGADALDSGDHFVRMTVSDSSTGFRIISLSGQFST